jgi:hypothetical protein
MVTHSPCTRLLAWERFRVNEGFEPDELLDVSVFCQVAVARPRVSLSASETAP